MLLKGMLNIRLFTQPLYFNEVCFTSGICFVARCKSPSVSVQEKGFWWSRLGRGGCGETLVGTGQASNAAKCSCHSCPESPRASGASAFITQKL